MKKIAYFNTFDPPLLYNIEIINKIYEKFKNIILVIQHNDKSIFTVNEKKNMLKKCCESIAINDFQIYKIPSNMLEYKFAEYLGIDLIIKDIYNIEKEKIMLNINKEINFNIETLYVVPINDYVNDIQVLKKIVYSDSLIYKYIPECIVNDIKNKLIDKESISIKLS